MKIKSFFKNQAIGFYILLGSLILTLTALIIYLSNYSKIGEINLNMMSWESIILMIIGLLGTIALVIFKKTSFWAPMVLAIFNYAALLLYIKTVYMYIAIAAVGIDISTVSNKFIITTLFLALSTIMSVISIFFKQKKNSIA